MRGEHRARHGGGARRRPRRADGARPAASGWRPRSPPSPPCRARRRGRGRRGCGRSRPAARRAARANSPAEQPRPISSQARQQPARRQRSRDFQETGRIRVDVHRLSAPLCSADRAEVRRTALRVVQPRPISCCAMASATSAGSRPLASLSCPDLLEPAGDRLDPRADRLLVAVAQIFGRDVDDAAGVDHVIGRVEDAARRGCGRRRRAWRAGCWRRRRRSAR